MKKLLNFIIKIWLNIKKNQWKHDRSHLLQPISIFFSIGLMILLPMFSFSQDISLLKNGGFEIGIHFPEGWIVPEGKYVRFIKADPVHNRVLALNSLDSYSTDTISYSTPLVFVDNNQDLILEADIKTLGANLNMTIVGFGDVCGQSRVVYRALKVFQADHGQWRRITRTFCLDCKNFRVKSLKIIFSSSGNPGRIFIDNIRIYPKNVPAIPLPEKVTKPISSESDSPIA